MNTVTKWHVKRLDEIGVIYSGATPSTTKQDYWDGEIVWVTPSDLSRLNSVYLHDSAKKISESGLKNCSAQLLPARSIVISSRAPIGYVAIPLVDFCTNQGCKSIKLRSGYDSEFAYYNITFHVEKLKNVGEGTTFAEISKVALEKIEMPFPDDKREQTGIASVLCAIDRAIEQTEALIAKQQRIKTGLMQDLLTKGIDEHGNIRSEATHAFKDSPLGRIPVEWDAKLLDECVRSDAPICYGILMPGTGVDDGVPVIKVKDIFDGAICLDDILLTDPKIDAAYKRSRLRTNDLLITIRGTTGRVALVPSVLDGANITQDTARIRLKDGHLPVYFFYLLQSADVQAQVDLQTLGQAVKGINIAEVRKLRVLVPSEDEQNRICQLLGQVNSAWQVSVNSRDKLLLQKAGLMHDLLTGKRRVTPLLAPAATA